MEDFNSKLLTETQFSQCFFEKLKQKLNAVSLIKIENLEIKTKNDSGEEYFHYLDNAYSEYLFDPKELDEIIERYTNGSKSLYFDKEPIKLDRIVPIIKDQRFLIEASKINENIEESHVFEQYNSDLLIFYAEDLENSISYLQKEDFENLNIDILQLRKIAIENLDSILENIERNGDNNIFMMIAGGNYEASLILLDIWNNDNFPVDGELIIGIPSRDLLFVTGSNSTDEIEELRNKIREINETGDHIVSNKLFKMSESNIFEVWE